MMNSQSNSQLDSFTKSLRRRMVAPGTLRAYTADVAALLAHTKQQLPTSTSAASFVDGLISSGASPATVARKIAALRAFGRYLVDTNQLEQDPTSQLKGLRKTRSLPKTITQDDAARLLAVASDPNALPDRGDRFPRRQRDELLIRLLYNCGLRSHEAAGLTTRDVDLKLGMLTIRGKGRKTRLVPFDETTKARLGALLTTASTRSSALLTTANGNSLATADIRRIVAYTSQAAGLPHVSPHMLRHAIATHLLEGGADLRVIQEFLGHSSVKTTEIYTHVSTVHLRAAYDAARPQERREIA